MATYVLFVVLGRHSLNYGHIIPQVEDDTVRYELLSLPC